MERIVADSGAIFKHKPHSRRGAGNANIRAVVPLPTWGKPISKRRGCENIE